MQIKYWTSFSKRKNSTKQPTGGTQVDVALKNPCSILNPTFETSSVPDNVNYVQAFGNYYFVTDVTHLTEQTIQITCAIDAMATAKSQIGSTTALVEYTSSSNKQTITDPRNMPTSEILNKYNDLGALSSIDMDKIEYIVGAASDEGVNYYSMTANDFKDLMKECFSTSIAQAIDANFFDLKNVVASAIVLPMMPTVGLDDIEIQGHLLKAGVNKLTQAERHFVLYEDTKDVYYPSDDIVGLSGQNYLDASPYTTGMLYLPFVGCVELDTATLASQKSVYIKAVLDRATGDLVYKIGLDANNIIATYAGNCAATVPLTSNTINPTGAVGGVMSVIGGVAMTAAGAATKNPAVIASGFTSELSGYSQMFQSLQHHTQTNGSLSSYVSGALGTHIIAEVITRKPANTDIKTYQTAFGLPFYEMAQISTLSGYVKCSGASVDLPGLDQIRDEVNGYLNSGFFYE